MTFSQSSGHLLARDGNARPFNRFEAEQVVQQLAAAGIQSHSRVGQVGNRSCWYVVLGSSQDYTEFLSLCRRYDELGEAAPIWLFPEDGIGRIMKEGDRELRRRRLEGPKQKDQFKYEYSEKIAHGAQQLSPKGKLLRPTIAKTELERAWKSEQQRERRQRQKIK